MGRREAYPKTWAIVEDHVTWVAGRSFSRMDLCRGRTLRFSPDLGKTSRAIAPRILRAGKDEAASWP